MPLKRTAVGATAILATFVAVDAHADSAERPPSHGFQMSIRTGVSFPTGDATGASGDTLGRRYAWQIPLALDLGGKVSDSVYVGGYLGLGFGGEGSDFVTESACRDDDDDLQNDIACSAFSFRLGVEGEYSFSPGERWNPWIGYGVGFESSEESIEDRRRHYRETQISTGYTLGKISVGVDRRAAVGFGPFLEVALGRLTHGRTLVNDAEVGSGTIPAQAFHAWITLGLRMVIRP
ncbi:MAG TPA: hypothetical protein VHE30_05590 [Polyangiaceae bacterium]|nr:hypothetical protein [Polyangiaceae bacterium]